MGKWNNRWIPNQRSHRPDNSRRFQPPHIAEDKESSVPEWEKKFCYKVGSVPWRKVLETKSYASYYPDVMNWDDSEAKDAFHTAKRRFWALLNGLPADDVPLPDPNAYIDEIDWNNVDTDLYGDLESALLAADGDVEGVTESGGNGVVDISALTGNSKWKEWNRGTEDDVWDNGGHWDKSSDGGWGKADKWDSAPDNGVTNHPKIAKTDEKPWECEPAKVNGPVKNNAWGDSSDKSWGWKQPGPSYLSNNQHDVVNPHDGNFQGGSASRGNGWTVSGNNNFRGRNSGQNKFNKAKAWGYGYVQNNELSTEREWSRHGYNSQCGNSLANNLHKQTDAYHRSSGNLNIRSRGDRKRESSNNYTPRSKSPMFQRTGNRRHELWSHGPSMQQTGSTFRVQT